MRRNIMSLLHLPPLPFYQSGCALLYNHMRSVGKVAPHGQLRIALSFLKHSMPTM